MVLRPKTPLSITNIQLIFNQLIWSDKDSKSSSGTITAQQWASQVPRCDCPSAPSPSTPGCPAAAHARYFAAGSRLHHIRQAGHIQRLNEAETGSLALGLTRSQSKRITSFASRLSVETGPLPVIGYPDTGGRCYVTNEQLSRLTPFSQQVAPGFAWRS